MTSREISLVQRTVDGVSVIALSGSIGEKFPRQEIGALLCGDVALDLSKITRVTSFGVRAWLDMLADCSASLGEFYFLRCSTAVVSQLGMIRGFAGSGRILSFAAPYLCDTCGDEFDKYLDVSTNAQEILDRSPLGLACHRCGENAEFDDHPSQYFSFATEHVGELSEREVNLLAACVDTPQADTNNTVEKEVIGSTTSITARGRIDEHYAWEHALEGVEGSLVIDLRDAIALDKVQGRRLASAIFEVLPHVDSIRLEGCPSSVVELFGERGFPPSVTVNSLFVSSNCRSCDTERASLLTVADLANGSPYRVCRRCSDPLEFPTAQKLAKALPKPSARAGGDVASPSRAISNRWTTAVLGLAIVAVLSAVAVVVKTQTSSSKERSDVAIAAASKPAVATVALAAVPPARTPDSAAEPAENDGPAEPPLKNEWAPAELAPAWTEQPFRTTTEGLLVVGRSETRPTTTAAIAAARASATQLLLEHLSDELAGTRLYETIVGTRQTALRSDAAEVITALFNRQVGDVASLERKNAVVKESSNGLMAIVQYRLAPEAYHELLSYYRASTRWRGMEVTPIFPLVAARMAPTMAAVQVVKVSRRSTAQRRGVRSGDVILSVNGQPVTTPADFVKLARRSWDRTRPGARFPIELQSGAMRRTVEVRRPIPQKRTASR